MGKKANLPLSKIKFQIALVEWGLTMSSEYYHLNFLIIAMNHIMLSILTLLNVEIDTTGLLFICFYAAPSNGKYSKRPHKRSISYSPSIASSTTSSCTSR